ALIERQSNQPADVALAAGHEGEEILMKGAEPQSIIDQIGVLLGHKSLKTLGLLAQNQRLQLVMRAMQDDAGRGLIELPRLDADQPVFHVVNAADAVLAAQLVKARYQADAVRTLAI